MNEEQDGQSGQHAISLMSFMRHLAHELGNPVASIRMSAEMLLGDFPREMHHELFQIVMSESLRLESLIESAVYFSSIGAPTRHESEIASLVESAMKQGGIAIPINVSPAEGSETIAGDASQLARLLREIFQNAVQAGCSSIALTLRTEQNGVTLTIVDDGDGIPPEKLAQVFNPFYSSRDGQLGLGLNIARRIAELHAGTIDVAAADSGGTSVTIRLPQSSR